jgi:hypothetical protein
MGIVDFEISANLLRLGLSTIKYASVNYDDLSAFEENGKVRYILRSLLFINKF